MIFIQFINLHALLLLGKVFSKLMTMVEGLECTVNLLKHHRALDDNISGPKQNSC